MSGEQAKRHHLVSKFYLRYFANEAEQVMSVMLPGNELPFRQSIANASVRSSFYTSIGHDGKPTDAAERAFGLIEEAAADAWRRVAAGVWPLHSSARESMAGWIALHLVRGSGTRTLMSQMGSDMAQLEMIVGGRARLREVLRNVGKPFDDASVTREWISLFKDPLVVELKVNHHLQYVAQALPRITELLLDRWWLLTSFQQRGLATCDHPVYVLPNKDHLTLGMGTGIQNADTIHVPLTRRHSLTLALRDTLPAELTLRSEDGQVAGATATALYSNSCTVNSTRQTLFHHPGDRPLDAFNLPEPRTREIIKFPGRLWGFMPDEDRQVLRDAGLRSTEEQSGNKDPDSKGARSGP